jgi:integrase
MVAQPDTEARKMASVYRRGKKWWGKVQRDGTVLRHPLKTESKAIAQKRLRTWLDELDAVAWGESPRRSFEAAVERFAEEHLPQIRASSARRYLISLEWLGKAFEGLALDQITSARLGQFELSRRNSGASAPTVRRDLACLSSLFGCCMEWEWAAANPVPAFFKSRRKRGLRESPPRTRYLSHEEEARLLANATEPTRSAIIFAIETGLRLREQFSLRWDQVDLASKDILLSGKTKSGRPRRVPITGRAGTVLGTLQRIPKSQYVFRHPDGSPFGQMNKGLHAACRRAGIAWTRWHDLRRTCGCRLLQDKGLSMEAVAMWLGHSSITVTEKTYAFLDYETIRNQVTGTKTGTSGSGFWLSVL